MRFEKGNTPWNKGLKGWNEKYKNAGFQKEHGFIGGGVPKGTHLSSKTEFKKGLVPWNKGLYGVMKAWNKGLGKGSRDKRGKELETGRHTKWRKEVFERDDYTCQKCEQKGVRLEADHIKMWALYPELRYDIENGQTLCRKCHIEKTRKDLRKFWKNQFTVSKEYSLLKSKKK